jgi:hypothetical protein
VAAQSVPITTIAVAGQTVTVTTGSAHGLAVNSGLCLSAPANVCSVAETVPTSTTLTFTQPSNTTVAPCASSCGTGQAAPHVFILTVTVPSQAIQSIRYGVWLCTTKPVPRSGFTSAWTAGPGSTGATTAQNNALVAGSFIETVLVENFPASSTTAEIQTFLQRVWQTQQAQLANNTQPGAFYGSTWNGTTWTVQ